MKHKKPDAYVPADVPQAMIDQYIINYNTITKNTDRLMLFACDQKIEHLNTSFYGPNIHPDDQNPEHLFRIAAQGTISAFATQLGLIARYGKQFPTINYIPKLNSKTNLIKTEYKDPLSAQLWTVEQVLAFQKNSGLHIRGIGYTIYLGSEFESAMLSHAAQAVFEAHQHGLVTTLWVYPRGKQVKDERDGQLIAGAAGVAAALGSDFVKINPPLATTLSSAQQLAIAVQAAGNTKVICSGGSKQTAEQFLQELYDQIHTGGCAGSATGRNIHQRSLAEAIALTQAISALVYDNSSVPHALKIYKQTVV